jgi:acyl carrier protein
MKTKDDVIANMEGALELEEGSLNMDTTIGSIDEWDSLGHLSILSSLDVLFNGSVSPIANISQAESVEEIINILIENNLIDK